MKYGNFYDLESLTLLNRHEGCACSIKECDVEKVNRMISRMQQLHPSMHSGLVRMQ